LNCNETMVQSTEHITTDSYANPTLPPVYFQTTKGNTFEPLPCEMITIVTSYLDWGDYARLACVNSSFKSILRDAASYGGSASKWTLSMLFLYGSRGLEPNPALAIKYLKELAGEDEQVDTEIVDNTKPKTNEDTYITSAMRELSRCYFSGVGVSAVDTSQGLNWLKTAFRHGDINSSYEIATVYEHGKYGIPTEIFIAAEWLLKAAHAGHVEAMAEYAMCCELGCGVAQSDEEAVDWYMKAANEGHATANYSIGEMFEEARGGLPQNDSEAVMWYYKAALIVDEDSKLALRRLGDIARIVIPGWNRTLNV
jgi:TPR repeat protein